MMDCRSCKFSHPIPGDSHLECMVVEHPALRFSMALHPYELPPQFIRLNPHGVENGWAVWPLNFDPIWVDHCAFYLKRGESNDTDGPLREQPDHEDGASGSSGS